MVTAVGFDLDGTLFDHEGAAGSAIEGFLLDRGWSHPGHARTTWLALEEIHFRSWSDGSISFREQRRRRMRGFVESVGIQPDDHDLDALFDEYLVHYRHCWAPYADVLGALDRLRSMDLRLAVLTNGDQAQQEDKLRQMGVLHEFDVVLAGSTLPAFKPSALAFAALCAALGLPADSILYVGDDLDADVRGAAGAGLRPVWIDRHGRGTGPDGVLTIASLDELPGCLQDR